LEPLLSLGYASKRICLKDDVWCSGRKTLTAGIPALEENGHDI